MTDHSQRDEVQAEGFTKTELNLTMNFLDQIPFNKLLGLKPKLLSNDRCEFTMSMKDDLVGNWLQGILHGGAISTALDVTGGAMALIATWQRMNRHEIPKEQRPQQLSKLGTIDMRVDFLHPGKGKEFVASATLLRIGNKVAVTRMEFHNEEGQLIAVGTGTYLTG
ncbi:thioesterase family protein [Bacterioplanoides sp.]|uniref:thioesterase family protein n=1 Tax=Bacterioplanoides sp. TaxID=2066072 RepID=UPI003B5BBFED